MQCLYASRALLPEGWTADVAITVDDGGTIVAVQAGADPAAAIRLAGPVVPGLPNLHSHAFQRAMAGLAERGSGEDSFWGWRELMYRFLARLTPEDVEAIAGQLYVEMLRAGYTAVGEFHYLCRAPGGQPYDDPAEMAERIAAAAQTAGIGLTLLPVIYTRGGFDGAPLAGGQPRFRQDAEEARDVAERVLRQHHGQIAVGIAPHSLRACTPSDLKAALDGLDPAWPVHIHAAEQQLEVQGALASLGTRPVAYLLDLGLDRRWCVIHATHMDDSELAGFAASGAVAGLCPTTEANLGDGVFRAREYLAVQGRFGIGSDSHISVNPAEELRLLEYGQRLLLQRRAVLAGPGEASTGGTLYRAALEGGAAALGRPIGRIAPGCRADLVVLDPASPSLLAREGDALLDGWLFAASACPVRDVMAGGRMVVQAGRHVAEEAILARYAACLRRLLA